jgi:hypothetical protein
MGFVQVGQTEKTFAVSSTNTRIIIKISQLFSGRVITSFI